MIQEETLQKVTHQIDQMYIEDDEEGIEEVEYVDLTPVPDVENDFKNDSEKKQFSQK